MTALTKNTPTKLTRGASKKKMQAALKAEIDKIDAKLKEFGVDHEIKYRIIGALTNFESPQNTINIASICDINTLVRWLAHYEKLQASFEAFRKEFGIPDTHVFINQNGQVVDNIVHDLRLRMRVVVNAAAINALTQARAKLLPFLDEESRLFNTLSEVSALYKTM